MSNCVGSSGLGLPARAVAQHGVDRGDHLAHDGDKDDLGLLARRLRASSRDGGGVVNRPSSPLHYAPFQTYKAAGVYAVGFGPARNGS